MKKQRIDKLIAWILLVAIGINCFGQGMNPGIAKVLATNNNLEEDVLIEENMSNDEIVESETTIQQEPIEYSDMNISSVLTLTEDLEVNNLTIKNTLHLNGYQLIVHGDLVLDSYLFIEEGSLIVKGDFTEKAYAYVEMKSQNDYVQIDGDYICPSNYNNEQDREKGTWKISGNVSCGKGNSKSKLNCFGKDIQVVLCGSVMQTIDVDLDSPLVIKNLVIENTSVEGVLSQHMLLSDVIIDPDDKLSYMCGQNNGITLEEDIVIEGDYCITGETLDLAGYNMTIKGNLIHPGGTIIFNGGNLVVEGDYKRQLIYEHDGMEVIDYSTGRLIMNQEDDYFLVYGNILDAGLRETLNDLTDGIIELKGSLIGIDTLEHRLLQTSSKHHTKFTGDGEQSIYYGEKHKGDYIRFANLTIAQAEQGNIYWDKPIAVTDSICHNSGNITGLTRLESGIIHGEDVYGDVEIVNEYTFTKDITFHGDVTVCDKRVSLYIGDCHITVKGNLINKSTIWSGNGLDSIITIEKNYIPYEDHSCKVSNMTIQIHGDFCGNEKAAISCGVDVEVQFIGTSQQRIEISHNNTVFSNIYIDNISGVIAQDNVVIENVVCNQGVLTYASGGIHGFKLMEDMEYDGDLTISGGCLDINGHNLHVKGNLTIENGTLCMTQSSDYVLVDGDFTTKSMVNHKNMLTDGVLEVKGDFLQSGNNASFVATENHTTILSGTREQVVTFHDYKNSYFMNVKLENETGIKADEILHAKGHVDQTGAFDGTLGISTSFSFGNGKFQGDIQILQSCSVREKIEVFGNIMMNDWNTIYFRDDLTVHGDITLNEHSSIRMYEATLECDRLIENLNSGIIMSSQNDKLIVHKQLSVARGKYTNGSVIINGDIDFADKASNEFGDGITVEFSGEKKQTITMDGNLHSFSKVVLRNSSEEGIYISNTFNYKELTNDFDSKVTFANGGVFGYTLTSDMVIEEDFNLSAGVLDLNGYSLEVQGDFNQLGGSIQLNNGTLVIEGNYNTDTIVALDKGTLVVKGDMNGTQNITGNNTMLRILGNMSCVTLDFQNQGVLELAGDSFQTLTFGTLYVYDFVVNNKNGVTYKNSILVYGDIQTNGNPVVGWLNCYGTITEDAVNANVNFATEYMLTKDLAILGNVKMGKVDLNKHCLKVMGDCTLSSQGFQDDGTLEIKGDLLYDSDKGGTYTCTDDNKIVLSGDSKQIIKKNYAKWNLNEIVICNTSEEGVYSEELLNVNRIVDENNKLSFPCEGDIGYQLTKDTVISGDFCLIGGKMDLNGYRLTVLGDLIQKNGTISINNGELYIEGDYFLGDYADGAYTVNSSRLEMNNDTDKVFVNGNMTFATKVSHGECMKAGVLDITGDLEVISIDSAQHYFDETMIFRFSGTQQQHIISKYSMLFLLKLGTIDIQNISSKGLIVTKDIEIANPVYNSQKLDCVEGATIEWKWDETPQFDSLQGNLVLYKSHILEHDLQIRGDISVIDDLDLNGKYLLTNNLNLNGCIKLNGGAIQVNKNLNIKLTRASFIMDNEKDKCHIKGDVIGKSGKLELLSGEMDVKGNFNLSGVSVISGDLHTVTFSSKTASNGTAYIQSINVPSDIVLNKIVLNKPRMYYIFNRDVEGMCKELIEDIQDFSAPTVPTGIVMSDVGYCNVTINWLPSTDDTQISCYELYRNDRKIMSLTDTTYIDYELQPGTEYQYYIIAKDTTRNVSAASDTVSVTTLEDKVAPDIPCELEATQTTATSLKLEWKASSDNVSTTGYYVYRDGQKIATTSKPSFYDSGLIVNSPYTYQIIAFDADNNESDFSKEVEFYTKSVCIDRVEPANYGQLSGEKQDIKLCFKNVGSSEGYHVYIGYKEKGEESYQEIISGKYGEKTTQGRDILATGTLSMDEISEEEIEVLVRITDASGYVYEELYTYYIDRQPPSPIDEFGVEIKDGVAVISYAKGIDADLAGYYIYRQEEGKEEELLVDIEEVGKTYYYDKTIQAGNTYAYSIVAYDKNGYVSKRSNCVSVMAEADTSAPIIEQVEPICEVLSGVTPIVINARDNKRLDKAVIELYDEKRDIFTKISECAFDNGIAQYDFDTSQYHGEITLKITVYDEEGNTNTDEYCKTYHIDNVGPSKIKNLSCEVLSTTVLLRWDAPTEDDFSHFLIEEKKEDDTWEKIGETTTVTGYEIDGLMIGSQHIYRVIGVDIYGNKGISSDDVIANILEDKISPRITKVAPNAGYYNSNIPLEVTAYDNTFISTIIIEASRDKETWMEISRYNLDEPKKEYFYQFNYSLQNVPEGDIYIRTYAIDSSGNVGDVNQILVQHLIDKTAPSAIDNLIISDTKGGISLSWNEPIENDVAGYNVYRSIEGMNAYEKIIGKVRELSFCDRTAKYGTSYTYQVTAIDFAGNESVMSNIVVGQKMADKEKPVVHSLVPEQNGWISGWVELSAYASDNDKLSHVAFYIRKKDDGSSKNLIETVPTEISGGTVTCYVDTTLYENGLYDFLVVATDASGNVSETYISQSNISNISLQAPRLYVTESNWSIQLSYSGTNAENYVLYRKQIGEREYTQVYSGVGNMLYRDADVHPNYTYQYRLVIQDKAGNQAMSATYKARPIAIDDKKPIANIVADSSIVERYQMLFNGLNSTDNDKIVEYVWDFGDGNEAYGPTPVHAYEEPGEYYVKLMVKDKSGNVADTSMKVNVLEKSITGSALVTVTNKSGTPLKDVCVFVNTSSEMNDRSYTDQKGLATIMQKAGTYRVALYKAGYIAKEVEVEIELHGEREYTFVLDVGDTISADFEVHEMTFEEMVIAGIDVNAPDNQHIFVARTALTYAPGKETPPKVQLTLLAKTAISVRSGSGPNERSEESKPNLKPSGKPVNSPKGEDDIKDLYYTIYITSRISWLKDMYEANLILYNNAESQVIVAEKLQAELIVPGGVSLAGMHGGQSNVKHLEDIRGGESTKCTWYVCGDAPGTYNLMASVKGVLQPFDIEFISKFESNPFKVTAGDGLVLTIRPQQRVYPGHPCYIHFVLANKGKKEFHNVVTNFSLEGSGSAFYVADPDDPQKSPIFDGTNKLAVDCMTPGEYVEGFYITHIPLTDDKYDFMELIKYQVKVLEGANLGVTIKVEPIPSYVAERSYWFPTDNNSEGDPVNVSTGAYMDSFTALTVNGVNELSADLKYDSTAATYLGDFGYGWTHSYEDRIETMPNGLVRYYPSPAGYYTFIPENYDTIEYKLDENNRRYTDVDAIPKKVDFECLNDNKAGYTLKRDEEGNYTLTNEVGATMTFDVDGKMTSIVYKDGKMIDVEHSDEGFVVKDVISGRYLEYTYNKDGLIEKVSDHTERCTYFYYDEQKTLKQFTNALYQDTYYTLDSKHHILKVTDHEGNCIVTNTYDQKNRVIEQKDGLDNITKFSYEEDNSSGDVLTTITTPSGKKKTVVTDMFGNITRTTNEAGDITDYTYDMDGNERSVNNPNGYSVVYDYDNNGNMISVKNSMCQDDSYEVEMQYDASGNMTYMSNCTGERMSCTYYDKSGLIKTKTDQHNNKTTYEYNECGQLLTERDSSNKQIEYGYAKNGDLISIKDKNGNYTEYTYNDIGLAENATVNESPISGKKGAKYFTATFYDSLGRVIEVIDANDGKTNYEYDCRGNVVLRKDPGGAVTIFSYDNNNQLQKEIIYASEKQVDAGNATSVTNYTYTKDGLLESITDGISGTVVENVYDSIGNKIQEIEYDKDGQMLSKLLFKYDLAGNIIKETQVNVSGDSKDEIKQLSNQYHYYPNGKIHYTIDTSGIKTVYTYDESFRVQSVISGTQESLDANAAPVLQYVYDDAGRVKKEVYEGEDGLSISTEYSYDIYGNVISKKDNKKNVTTYRYDGNNNLIETEDVTGRILYNHYDSMNRVIETGVKIKEGQNQVTKDIILLTNQYNVSDRSVTQKDEVNGTTVTSYYNYAGLVYKTVDNETNATTETIYDTEGRVLQTTDANGLLTEYSYNDYMQVAKVTRGQKGKLVAGKYEFNGDDIREETYSYDSLGRMYSVADVLDTTEGTTEQVQSSITYDGFGRIQTLRDPNQNAAKDGGYTYQYSYDEYGLLSQETNSIGNVTKYQYNENRLLSTVIDSANEKTAYEYDSLNRISKIKDTAGLIEYQYDENGNIREIKETDNWAEELLNNGRIIRKEYDELDRIRTYTDSNGRTIKYAYDALGNVKSLSYPGGEIVTYTYNDAGLMTGMQFRSNSGGIIYTWNYSYDSHGRLSKIIRPDKTTETRTYDIAGNLLKQTDVASDGKVLQENLYVYNEFGEITEKVTYKEGNIYRQSTAAMTYNSANRLISWNNQSVSYDEKGNMLQGPVNGTVQELEYDARNRLVKAGDVTYEYDAENNRIATIQSGEKTEYLYDTSAALSKMLVAYESNGSSTIYCYGAEGLAGQYNNVTKETLFYHFDNIGSTTMLTNQAGNVVERIAYGTYGELLSILEKDVRFLYNGAYGVVTDSNGLYYMRARYYNPDIKRFINQDIKVGDISNGQGLNRYAYCEGNPVSLIDPFGLCGQDPNGFSSLGINIALGLGGMLPVVGVVFDLVDAAVCYYNKDTLGMTLALASAIPFVGLVSGAAKAGKHVAKFGGMVTDMIRSSKRIQNTVDVVAKASSNCRKIIHAGATDVMTALAAKGKDAAKIVKGGSDKFQELGSMLKNQRQRIHTSIKASSNADAGIRHGIGKKNRGYIVNPFYKGGKTSTGYTYWSKSIQFDGNKVYQRNDLFDPMQVSSWKRNGKTITGTNIERMAAGNAPIGYDGKSVNLHHLLQTPEGPIVEVSNSFHKQYYSTIHMNTGKSPSLINRNEFNKWSSKYWMNRSLDFQ